MKYDEILSGLPMHMKFKIDSIEPSGEGLYLVHSTNGIGCELTFLAEENAAQLGSEFYIEFNWNTHEDM